MASFGQGFADAFTGTLSSLNTAQYQQGLLRLEQQRLQQEQQNKQRAEYMDLLSKDIQFMGQNISALKNQNPNLTDLQISSNPGISGIANRVNGLAKNLGLGDNYAAPYVAGYAAGPSQIQTEGALARAKEGPLATEEKKARIDYLRSGIPGGGGSRANMLQNPDAPGLPGNDAALGTPATFNQRFAQSFPTSTTDVGADVGEQAGEDYLKKSVDPADADLVRSVANYDTDPNTPSGRVPRGQLKSRREAVIEQAMAYAKAKGETYNPRAFKVVQDFLGAGKHGDLVRSLNVVTDHMQTIKSLGEALHNGDNQTINAIFQRWATEFGKPAPTNMTLGLKLVGTELVKAMGVAGAGSKEDRQELQNTINTSSSNSQIIGAVDRVAGPLLSGQLNGLRNQFVSGGGPRERFDKALFPATKKYLDSERGAKPTGTGEWSVERID